MQPARAQLTLEIELDSEPICGSIADGGGPSKAFSGWIELVSLVQGAATTHPSGKGQPSALAAEPQQERADR
jgi:hypothetical protein